MIPNLSALQSRVDAIDSHQASQYTLIKSNIDVASYLKNIIHHILANPPVMITLVIHISKLNIQVSTTTITLVTHSTKIIVLERQL